MKSEMKCTNEKMTWNTQDTNLSWYVPKVNVDQTISGQGTAVSTLDRLATTPRTKNCKWDHSSRKIECWIGEISTYTYSTNWIIQYFKTIIKSLICQNQAILTNVYLIHIIIK